MGDSHHAGADWPDPASERRVLELLIDAARRLKWSLNYRGSKDTHDLAQQAYENLLRRGRGDELRGSAPEIGGLLWTAARNAILDEKRRVRGNAQPGEVKRPPPGKRASGLDVDEVAVSEDPETIVLAHNLHEALKEALAAYERGEWRRAPKQEERERHVAFFRAALEGETHEVIAERFQVARETVTKKLGFVCAWLKVRLAEQA